MTEERATDPDRVMGLTGREKRLLVSLAVIHVPLAIVAVRVAGTGATTDFYCFWSGSSFVLQGRDPYDEVAWTSATSGISLDAFDRMRGQNCYTRYLYPLATGVALVPLAALPLGLALCWTAIYRRAIALGSTALTAALLARPRSDVPRLFAA